MELDDSSRIADSSVLIGFPVAKATEYTRFYEGKQVFVCSVSIPEVRRYFRELTAGGKISDVRAVLLAAERMEGLPRLEVSDETHRIAGYLSACYEIVWGSAGRQGKDYNDMLIAACAIEHKMALIAHDKIFQRIEVMFPSVFRLYTRLPSLSEASVEQALSRIRQIDEIPKVW